MTTSDSSSDSKLYKWAALAVAVLVALFGAGYCAHINTGPRITLSPDHACNGQTIVLTGSSWNHDQQISIYVNGGAAGNAYVQSGDFTDTLSVSGLSVGTYTVEAVGQQTNDDVKTNLRVTGNFLPGLPGSAC